MRIEKLFLPQFRQLALSYMLYTVRWQIYKMTIKQEEERSTVQFMSHQQMAFVSKRRVSQIKFESIFQNFNI